MKKIEEMSQSEMKEFLFDVGVCAEEWHEHCCESWNAFRDSIAYNIRLYCGRAQLKDLDRGPGCIGVGVD